MPQESFAVKNLKVTTFRVLPGPHDFQFEVGDGFDPENATENVGPYKIIFDQILLASKLIYCFKPLSYLLHCP
jgi:hypothetical protein